MQTRSELTALAPRRLTWKLPHRRHGDHASEQGPVVAGVLTRLRTAQREVLKDNRVEQWVWIGLAVASLAVIVVSIWL
jgi:hypothetical protein